MKRILLSFIILLFSYTAHADLESWMGIPIVDLESIAGIPIVDLESWAGQTIPSGGGTFTATYKSTSQNATIGTTVVVTAPTVADGDLILAFCSSEVDANTATATGFTAITSEPGSEHSQYTLYKEASSESGDYTFNFVSSAANHAIMVVVAKDGGSWVVPTTAGYNDSTMSGIDTTTADAGTVTVPAGSTLVCGFSSDATASVSTPPASMTISGSVSSIGTNVEVAYYQEYSSSGGSVNKTLEWSVSKVTGGASIVAFAN